MQTQKIHYIPSIVQENSQLRVAAYARVSSSSDDQLESYAAQIEHYEQLFRDDQLSVLIDLYADEGITGTRADKRPDFQRMMQDCRDGKIDKIITKSISRFARNTSDCLKYIRELKALGIEVFFEQQKLDTSIIGGEMMLAILGAGAQEESVSISSNMRWSYQHRMKRGEFITQSAPYGYSLAGTQIVVAPPTAAIVQYIFSQYLSGVGMDTIANDLNSMKLPTPHKSKMWYAATIHFILKNEKYIGDSELQKTYTTDSFPFVKKQNRGELPKYYVENSHEPIISKEAAEKVQLLLEFRHTGKETTWNRYPFSLMIYCPECGASFRRRVTRGKVYWGCRSHDKNREICSVGRTPEVMLEQAFVHMHRKLRAHIYELLIPMLEQLATLRERALYRQERIAEIDISITSTRRQTMLLTRLFGEGHMDAAYFHTQNQQLGQIINSLRRERRHLTETADDGGIRQTEALIDILRRSPKHLDSFDAELFASIVKRMTIDNCGKIHFQLINGLEVTEWPSEKDGCHSAIAS